MTIDLTKREAAQVLAALRNWQEESAASDLADNFEAYFEGGEPLSSEEIDALCERIAAAAASA